MPTAVHLLTAPLGARRELERTSTSARSAPAKDVAQAAEGGDNVGRQSSNGAAAPPEGLKARIQGLVQSLRAVTEVRMRRSSQALPPGKDTVADIFLMEWVACRWKRARTMRLLSTRTRTWASMKMALEPFLQVLLQLYSTGRCALAG